MKPKQLFYLIILALLLSLAATACWRSQTPPGPDMAGGGYENATYEFFHWQEGLNIMVWQEAVTESSCDSSGSTNVDTHFVQCRALTQDGLEFTWQIATKDGRTAEFRLDGQPYDLADGNLFLINIENGILDVQQLQRDFSEVAPTHDSITQFGQADLDISQFIKNAAAPDS